jgi:hypothetical protein
MLPFVVTFLWYMTELVGNYYCILQHIPGEVYKVVHLIFLFFNIEKFVVLDLCGDK